MDNYTLEIEYTNENNESNFKEVEISLLNYEKYFADEVFHGETKQLIKERKKEFIENFIFSELNSNETPECKMQEIIEDLDDALDNYHQETDDNYDD